MSIGVVASGLKIAVDLERSQSTPELAVMSGSAVALATPSTHVTESSGLAVRKKPLHNSWRDSVRKAHQNCQVVSHRSVRGGIERADPPSGTFTSHPGSGPVHPAPVLVGTLRAASPLGALAADF